MKKILVLLMLLNILPLGKAWLGSSASAQVKFGVRAGYNLTNVTGGINADNKAGFYAGPTVKFTVPVVGLSFDASAVYDQRKAGELTSKQIAIPINIRYGVGLGSTANIFAFAGPQFGFNVGKNETIKDDVADWKWKSSNFSVNVGIGATILNHFELRANYNIACGKTGEVSFSEAASAATDIVKGDAKYNAWQLGLAYYF